MANTYAFYVSGFLRVAAHCDDDAELTATEAARELGLTEITVTSIRLPDSFE